VLNLFNHENSNWSFCSSGSILSKPVDNSLELMSMTTVSFDGTDLTRMFLAGCSGTVFMLVLIISKSRT